MPSSPESVGPYKVIGVLGQGEFATVYLASGKNQNQPKHVAVKVLHLSKAKDEMSVRRFQQEAQIILKLNELDHPHIIKIFDSGGTEDTFYIVMEYISGGSLGKKLETGPFPRIEAIDIIKKIGLALSAAHNHKEKIIHRDLKPHNILIDDREDTPRPVLSDFGLVKRLSSETLQTLTITGSVLGTPHYMAPEQCEAKDSTFATDLYALAIIFFEMLAGFRPFEGDSVFELMRKHSEEPFPRLSSIAPQVDAFFDDILIKATAKDPAKRFASITEFTEALETANNEFETLENELGSKYQEIQKSIKLEEYSTALEHLKDRFNYKNNYQYRDVAKLYVAKLFWAFVYDQQYRDQYPVPKRAELHKLRKVLAEKEEKLENAGQEIATLRDKLEKLQQKKRVIIYRNVLIFVGIVFSVTMNLLFSFLFRVEINTLAKWLVIVSTTIIALAGILTLYRRISQQ